MNFLIDENISYCVVDELKKMKFNIVSIAEKFSSLSDKKIYDKAIKEKRVIITRDYHFSNSLFFPPDKTMGIIYIRYGNLKSTDELQIIMKFINSNNLNKIAGKFVTLYKDKISIRK